MAIKIYHYRGCSTCRKAIKWLESEGLEYIPIPIVDSPPSAETLGGLHRRSGLPLKKFFNTSGQSYRRGGWRDKVGTLGEALLLDGLAADGMLIKRPLLDAGEAVLVGFSPEAWSEALGS